MTENNGSHENRWEGSNAQNQMPGSYRLKNCLSLAHCLASGGGQNMNEDRRCCGTCKYHQHDDGEDWICVNTDSEYVANWTEYEDCCENWEGNDDKL